MSSRARLSKTARKDLQSIYRYIAVDQGRPQTADRQIELIFDRFAFLAQNPLMGEQRDDLRRGLRTFSAESFVIFYRVFSGGISITRVIHGSRDWTKLF
jgi:toxin ParE1/3/4